jgi:hypothetical protein
MSDVGVDVLLAAGEGPSTTTDGPSLSPLFLAEVDDIDTTAVLALLAVLPTSEGKGLRVFERRDGGWKEVPQYVKMFNSVAPPTVVELDRETLLQVVDQLDMSDLSKGGKKQAAEPAAEGAESETAPADESADTEDESAVEGPA